MQINCRLQRGLAWTIGLLAAASLHANNLDLMGVTLLRQVDATLQGSNVMVAQVEGTTAPSLPPPFEVDPAFTGQPGSLFTYHSDLGTATNFPNAVGAVSYHATDVANNFFGAAGGVAPQVAHVDNYEAEYFYTNFIDPLLPPTPAIPAQVVNQSFIFNVADENIVNPKYDDYAAQHGTLFVSGAGNGDVPVSPAATCYNGIGVGVVDGNSSVGPTADGRSKPDLTAPGSNGGTNGATSYSTPYVSGAAAVLLQAAARGDGGTNVTAAGDSRTVKALLLNGAVKPIGWTNGPTTPLDGRYGAGVVNVFNSWTELSGGQRAFVEFTTVPGGNDHPPGSNTNNIAVLSGWDFNSLVTSDIVYIDQVNHYYFNLPANAGTAFTLTATLVWQRHQGQSAVNNLQLFLYNTANSNLVAASTSAVDNVEHIFLPTLPAGRYDLQVLKVGNPSQVSTNETYALAFEFFSMPLSLALTNGNVVLSWPIAPTGFRLQSTTNLTPPIVWSDVNAPVSLSNDQNIIALPANGAQQHFRLQRP